MQGFSMETGEKIGKYSLSIIECEIEKTVDVAREHCDLTKNYIPTLPILFFPRIDFFQTQFIAYILHTRYKYSFLRSCQVALELICVFSRSNLLSFWAASYHPGWLLLLVGPPKFEALNCPSEKKMANIDKVKPPNYLNIHVSGGFYASGLERRLLRNKPNQPLL